MCIFGLIKNIKDIISDKNVDEITTDDIQGYLNSQVEYSDSTIKKLKEQFGQAFNYAINKGYISKNPMLGVIRPKSLKDSPPIRAMTLEEETKFVDYITSKPLEECPYRNEYLIQLLSTCSNTHDSGSGIETSEFLTIYFTIL